MYKSRAWSRFSLLLRRSPFAQVLSGVSASIGRRFSTFTYNQAFIIEFSKNLLLQYIFIQAKYITLSGQIQIHLLTIFVSNMKLFKKFIAILYTVYAFAVFLSFMFLLLPFIVIASFFGKIKGGNFIYRLCRIWARFVLFMLGMYHKNIFESPPNSCGVCRSRLLRYWKPRLEYWWKLSFSYLAP